jgi:hypothetical protein
MFEVTFSVKRYFDMKGKGRSGVCGGTSAARLLKDGIFLSSHR